MYLPALPALSRELGATMSQTQLTLSTGILGLALGQVIAGPSSDALGRRRPLLIGVAAFALASLLCIIAPSVAALTVLRFVQGVAGAAGIAIALAIVSDLYAGSVQARVFSLLMLVSGLAPIIAPVIGSQLLAFTSWRGIFVILALIGIVLLLAVTFGLGETLPAARRQSGGLVASLRAFRDLLLDRRFVGYAFASGFAFAAGIVYISVSPFILQNIYGVSPQRIGILFGINALGLVIMAQVGGKLVGRVSSQMLLAWGVAAIAIGATALLVVVLSGIGLVGILPSLFVIIASLGLIAPNATTLALSNTSTAGSAAALLGVLQLTIGAIAAPMVGLAGTATAVPMAAAIAAFGITALLTFIVFCRPAPTQAPGV
jgi:DHA1 family bicyclomycin/chloramphenicol resistance-like MFS transporter